MVGSGALGRKGGGGNSDWVCDASKLLQYISSPDLYCFQPKHLALRWGETKASIHKLTRPTSTRHTQRDPPSERWPPDQWRPGAGWCHLEPSSPGGAPTLSSPRTERSSWLCRRSGSSENCSGTEEGKSNGYKCRCSATVRVLWPSGGSAWLVSRWMLFRSA